MDLWQLSLVLFRCMCALHHTNQFIFFSNIRTNHLFYSCEHCEHTQLCECDTHSIRSSCILVYLFVVVVNPMNYVESGYKK